MKDNTILTYIYGTQRIMYLYNRYKIGDIFHYKGKQYKVMAIRVNMWVRELEPKEYIHL